MLFLLIERTAIGQIGRFIQSYRRIDSKHLPNSSRGSSESLKSNQIMSYAKCVSFSCTNYILWIFPNITSLGNNNGEMFVGIICVHECVYEPELLSPQMVWQAQMFKVTYSHCFFQCSCSMSPTYTTKSKLFHPQIIGCNSFTKTPYAHDRQFSMAASPLFRLCQS